MLTFWVYRYPKSKQGWTVITKEKKADDALELRDEHFPILYVRYLAVQHIFGVKVRPGGRVLVKIMR